MRCLRCEQDHGPHANFCMKCGTPLPRPSDRLPPGDSYEELQQKVKHLTQALNDVHEQQIGTSEILRVISSSPKDLTPVFATIVGNATRLCEAQLGNLFLYEGDAFHAVAHHNASPSFVDILRGALQPGPETGVDHFLRERQPFQIPDVRLTPPYAESEPYAVVAADLEGIRTLLGVPLVKDERVIGVITIYRREVRPFTGTQIELVRTFASQAVIAIENVRLFTELEERNRDLTQALDRQTATAEVLRIIAQSPTELQPVLDAIATSAVRLCAASDAVIERLEGDRFYNAAHAGGQMKGLVGLPLPLTRRFPGGRAVLDRKRVILDDIHLVAETEYPDTLELLKLNTIHSVAEIPLLSEGKPLGSLAVLRAEVRPFTDVEIALLETFASQAVIAIENVRLFDELQARNRDLTGALDRQTATAEVLRVISSSSTDIQPVFDIIAERAAQLCGTASAHVFRFDGELIHLVAIHSDNPDPASVSARRAAYPRPPDGSTGAARAIRDRRIVHIRDVFEDPEYRIAAVAQAAGFRAVLVVPMLREGQVVGAISIGRATAGPFSDTQVDLLQTFADQAVIAIENARLLGELQARTAELTRSVEELTALGEVGHTLSSTLDLETVLQTIVARANQLAGTAGCAIWEYDEPREEFRLRVSHYTDGEDAALLQTPGRVTTIRKGQGMTAQVVERRQPVQIPDIAVEDAAYESPIRGSLIEAGHRALLGVPLLSEDHVIGVLAVTRKTPGEFELATVRLLTTFATQSALAIQNARLFLEIEDKSRQLEVASQHKSEFLANMSHELRTPLNAIIGFSEVLAEGMFGDINYKQAEYMRDILESGRHLLSLINDILDLSKIEAGRMELEPTDFDLPAAIDNALTLVRERAGRRDIALGQAIDAPVGMIRADERKVKQVLLNLLSNALKFTPEGGRIDVSAHLHDDLAEIAVSDTGVGIAPEDQEAVFEEFRQVGTASKKIEGTGLGLALSRKFIELHGGRIWVKSEVGVGSTFTFTLPVVWPVR